MKPWYFLTLLIFPVIIFGNVFIFHLIIKKAIKRFIEPKLRNAGLLFIDYKWPGFFSYGDFKYVSTGITTLAKTGPNSISIYALIHYMDLTLNLNKSVTAKIDVIGLSIEKVTYSGAF